MILRIISRMNVGGPAWQVSVLTRRIENSEFTSRLFCGEVGPGEADFLELRAPDIQVTKLRYLGRRVKPLDDLRALVQVVSVIRDLRPDVVHTHTTKAGFIGRIAGLLCRVPFMVHTFHGHHLNGYFRPSMVKVLVRLERILARFTDRLVAVGSSVAQDLIAVGVAGREKFVVVAPGVERFGHIDRDEAKTKLGVGTDNRVVLFVGRLTQIKRPDRLIEAFSIVHELDPATTLLVVGDGELLETTRLSATHLGRAVQFLGWRSDLDVLYSAADVALLTSDNEGMPVTLIEASMSGLPCVTTRVGSADEVVLHGETGFVVGSEPSEIAEAVLQILVDDGRRARMGSKAALHAQNNFGVDRLVEDHLRLYRNLVDSESSSTG